MSDAAKPHILVFEPRVEGHHLSWLRYVAEDFVSAGHPVTLGLPWLPDSQDLYGEHLDTVLDQVQVFSMLDEHHAMKGGSKLAALGRCLVESGADQAFMNNLDDIASGMLRRAAVGINPPRPLRGRLSGIYFRPRFLANGIWPPGNAIKMAGFKRLVRQGWFHRICLLDEFLYGQHKDTFAEAGLTFLPDTWSGDFSIGQSEARDQLGIDAGKLVLLHYGIGTRRKGLHLVIRALRKAGTPRHWHLLCAGKVEQDREILDGLRDLKEKEIATVLNRYVSKEEEQLCFAAADIVLMPYVHHFGSSGVLALAAAAGKMVIVSDGGLIAQRVRENHLGICFRSNHVQELIYAIRHAEGSIAKDSAALSVSAAQFADRCNREAFRNAITSTYNRMGLPNKMTDADTD